MNTEQLRKDMEAGTTDAYWPPSQLFTPPDGTMRRIARVPQLERIALAAEELAELVGDAMETQTDFATEWDIAAHEALAAYREATK